MIEEVHHVRGRLRVRLRRARRRPRTCAHYAYEAARLPGVTRAESSHLTGTLLLRYDPSHTDAVALGQALRAIDPMGERDPEGRHDAPAAWGMMVGNAVTGVILAVLSGRRVFLGRPGPPTPAVEAIATATTLVAGVPIFRGGLGEALKNRQINVDSLISVATLVSLVLRESLAGLVVVFLINLSTMLQEMTLDRARRALRDLLSLDEAVAWREEEGRVVRVRARDLRPGDVVVVHTGEKIPVDGVVSEGCAGVNQAALTGESMPILRETGDGVYAGTLVEEGFVKIVSRQVGEDTRVARIVHLVEQAATVRAPVQNVADEFSRRIVPWSFVLSAAVFALTRDIKRSMTMLVIACPCAAGLSTPTAVTAAIGRSARRGVLIKGGNHLQRAGDVRVIVFDKTGTLTTGRPHVATVHPLDGIGPDGLLSLAACAETHASHPLGRAVLAEAASRGLEVPPHEHCEALPGLGIRAQVADGWVHVGSLRYVERRGVCLPDGAHAAAEAMMLRGETVLAVLHEDRPLGLLGLTDTVRPEAERAIRQLRESGVERLLLATGDNGRTAAALATHLGLHEVHADLMPEDKARLVNGLRAYGAVAVVGDGINDAPALAAADLGFAIAEGGADPALEAADIALGGASLMSLPATMSLSRRTMSAIYQNFGFAVVINLSGILLGAVGRLSPLSAAFLHNLATLAVVLNSGRLLIDE